ncbi:MAG: sigma-70 family RNA polymerase sigma factor [Saprospiraceae bacterium]|uniref:Sigma-70 family RNA polymerase sigma factor n=1 Tax=Candidatus Opimibacter skivensis TaxID=2982028 RepID=A0A9D7SVH6_9BACT|nr:sigma-70 family RNA polymerase sigma factor [Candidatus Opimibacter skivensis]
MEETRHWEALKNGDPNGLRELYNAHVDNLYRYGVVLCHDSDKVKDCIHDLFVYVWNFRERLNVPDSTKAYLMVSLRRRIFEKGSKINSLTVEMDSTEESIVLTEGHEERWIQLEDEAARQKQLDNALEQLSERQREIIHMKYYQQLDYDEIGRIMNLNYQSARNLVTRALTALRKEMTIIITILFLIN